MISASHNRFDDNGIKIFNGNGSKISSTDEEYIISQFNLLACEQLSSSPKKCKTINADIVKLDIEGAEKEVFDRCDWLNRVRVVAIELHDRFKPGCSAAVNSATWQFSKSQRGEIIFYLRNS